MVDDPNRKTPRQFQCRDYLWDSFEQLSSELECSIDYLINEAMRHYLRAQGRTGPGKAPGNDSRPSLSPNMSPTGPSMVPAARPSTGQMSTRPGALPTMPQPRPPASAAGPIASPPAAVIRHNNASQPQMAAVIPPLATPGRPAAAMPAMPTLPQRSVDGGMQPAPMGRPAPMPAMPSSPGPNGNMGPAPRMASSMPMPPPPAANAQRVLYAVYSDQEVPVTKEEFFIGRGQKLCDLVIRDTNISRQHARVVLHNGQYWIIDNQSTNGVEFRGAKIQQKRVDDGDVFTICGHDVQFSYR